VGQTTLRSIGGDRSNLAMDLLIPQLARLIGVENATRLFLLFESIPPRPVTNH
jgi:hypothetical protein